MPGLIFRKHDGGLFAGVLGLIVCGYLMFYFLTASKDKELIENPGENVAAVQEELEDMGTFDLIPMGPGEHIPFDVSVENLEDTPLYVFDYPSVGATSTRGESFGTQDKIGIERRVINVFADRLADFERIRDDAASRDAFLLQRSGLVRQPNRHWKIIIFELEPGNILRVDAIRGNSVGDFDGGICEKWQLNSAGTPPTLIYRVDPPSD